MRIPLSLVAACVLGISGLLAGTLAASATVLVAIDLTHQRMHVDANEGSFDWPISSARSGFFTPGGSFAPTHLELMHYSKKYHMSPMPHAIFFRGGYAIHGTYATGSLGRPASHGCVRLSPGNAATLYEMVRREGARISIRGTPPASIPFAVARRARIDRFAATADGSTVEGYYGDPRTIRRAARRERAGYGYAYGSQVQPQYYGYQPGYTYAPAYLRAPQRVGVTRYWSPIPAFDQ